MKILLKDASGRKVEVSVVSTDSFADIAARVASEQGFEIDVGDLPITPDTNVLGYFGVSSSKNSIESENKDIEERCEITKNTSLVQKQECRLCALSYALKDLKSIFDFTHQIKTCLPVRVDRRDALSKMICQQCIHQLNVAYNFVSACLQAEKIQKISHGVNDCESMHVNDSINNVGAELSKDSDVKINKCPGEKKNIWRCNRCERTFRCKQRLSFHLLLHDKPPGRCPVCSKELPTEVCLYKHYLYNHLKRGNHLCDVCGRSFKNKSSLTYHSRAHTSLEAMRPYICDLCNRRFARKNTLRDHLASRHGATAVYPVHVCCHCQEVFPTAEAATSHADIHHSIVSANVEVNILKVSKLFLCEFCDKCYTKPNILLSHTLVHTHPLPYQCKICNEDLSAFLHLRSHLQEHFADGISDYKAEFKVPLFFLCQFCETNFRCYQSYRLHCVTHSGSLPYSCRACNVTLSAIEDAIKHRAEHEKETGRNDFTKPFECILCEKSFTSSSSLTKHMRIHTGQRPFYCNVCGKRFTQSSGLNTHLKIHSDQRPYQCDVCGKGFKIVGEYKVHLKRHSGETQSGCSDCHKTCNSKQVLLQHCKLHENKRIFDYENCDKSISPL